MTNDSKGSQSPGPLVETDWLAAQLGAPDLRVFDCTTHLIPNSATVYDVESGRAGYDEGHIPGAGFLDLHGELSDLESDLRFTLPPADQFAAAMSRHGVGVGVGTRVVLYSQTTVQWATRIWWMLKTFGFDDAMVLNGGLTKWRQEGRPLDTEPASHSPARFAAKPRPELIADKASVLAALDDPDSLVLNSLSHEQHAGGGRHYGRPGRITDSVCVPAVELLDADSGAYLPLDELRAKFEAVGALDAPRVVTYCGGGIAASSDSFILSLFGHEGVSLYDGSLSEWVRDPALPMETD